MALWKKNGIKNEDLIFIKKVSEEYTCWGRKSCYEFIAERQERSKSDMELVAV